MQIKQLVPAWDGWSARCRVQSAVSTLGAPSQKTPPAPLPSCPPLLGLKTGADIVACRRVSVPTDNHTSSVSSYSGRIPFFDRPPAPHHVTPPTTDAHGHEQRLASTNPCRKVIAPQDRELATIVLQQGTAEPGRTAVQTTGSRPSAMARFFRWREFRHLGSSRSRVGKVNCQDMRPPTVCIL